MLQDQCEYHAHTHDAHTDIISSPGAPVGAKNVPRYTREQWLLEVLLPKPKILKLCTKFLIRSNILGILVYPRQRLPDVPDGVADSLPELPVDLHHLHLI